MKQENKKSKKWLWLAIAGVALLVAAGVVLGLIFGFGGPGEQDADNTPKSKLYWNVDGVKFQNPEDPAFSNREPGEDGLYHIRFAVDGEQVEYTASDKKLVNYIDAIQVMGLELDESGNIIDVLSPTEIATEIANSFFVQEINGNTLTLNSSVALNGLKQIVTLDESVAMYDVRPEAEMVGANCSGCEIMDKVMIYGDMDENPTHVFVVERQPQAEAYWRLTRMYKSGEGTSRKPDENGVYTVQAAKGGGQMEVKFRAEQKALVDQIDKGTRYNGAFAPIFDEEGYVVELVDVARALRGKFAANSYDITALDETGLTCEYLMNDKNQGKVWTGKLHPDCKIYNVSDGGTADLIGEETKLQMGDRVVIYTNTKDEAILIYVVNRLVDGPMYYNVKRMYSSTTKETTRVPVNGYYVFELAVDGKIRTFKTKDKALATRVDSYSYRTFGLKVEGDIILRVYNPECVTGYFAVGANFFVKDIIGPILTIVNSGETKTSNPIMAADCKVYNMTGAGVEIGAADTLQIGDQIISYSNPAGELKYVYIVNRKVDCPLYWNHTRKFNSKTQETTRKPDENGYYVFRVAVNGKDTTVRTKSKALASEMDSYNPQWFALEVSGDIVKKVYPAKMATGGTVRSSYFAVESISSEQIITYSLAGSGTTPLTPAADMKVYNVTNAFEDHWGEQTKLKVGDQIHALTDSSGKTVIIYVRSRKVESDLYWNVARKYNTTKAESTRKPDAEGYYVYDLAVNGEVKQFKTKEKRLADMLDSYRIAVALKVEGNIIKSVYEASAAKGIKGSTASWLDVMSIDGNKVYVQQNIGTSATYGQGYNITLAKDYVVYDACGYVNAFGSKVTLGIGDRIHAFTNDDGEAAVIYIVRDNTREAGAVGYCAHCDKEVVWAPWSGEDFPASDGHYHVTHDLSIKQKTVGKEKGEEVYDIVLDLNGNTLTASTRSFLVWGGSTFSLMDSVGTGTVAAKGTTGNSGNILVLGGGKFNLYGGTLTPCEDALTAKYGGVLYLAGDNSVVNMYGGTITDGYGGSGGSVYMSGGTFNMIGGTVTKGKADKLGGNFQVGGKGVLNISGGNITDGVAGRGGNVAVADNGVVNISGGKLDKGAASLYGGNLFLYGNAKAIVSGSAEITNGTSDDVGGNIYISEEEGDKKAILPVLTISGGKISGGKLKSGAGSNIESYRAAEIIISGGNIAGDIALGKDADGFKHKIVLSGAPVIGKGLNNGLNLGSRTADISGLTKGANICVSTSGAFTAQMNNAESYKAYFTPYDSAMKVVVADKALICGLVAPCAHCGGADAVWSGWSGDALPQKDGHYRLSKNATTWQRTIGVEGGKNTYDVVIDLNGKTLTGQTRSFLVWYGSKLSVMDSVGGGVIETKGASNTAIAGSILLQRGAEFNLYSGTLRPVEGGVKAGKGGIIYMSTDTTTVNMYGGTIEGAEVSYGGAVYIGTGTFNMYGGTVTGGSASYGGNFYLEGGKLNVLGGTIEKGTSETIGGNIFADKSGKVNISGGTVSQGAAARGGNIGSYANAVVSITGGTVEKGDASIIGGNIFISQNGAVTISDDAVIADGVATNSGGNIYIAEEKSTSSGALPSLTITGGTISGGKLDNGNGDNIFTYRGAVVTISGGNIAGDVFIGKDLDGYVHSLSITGKPVIGTGISGGLDLGGRKIDASLLDTNARITISKTGVFTGALTDPNAHMNKFQAYGEDLAIGILGDALFCDRYTECEHCDGKVLWTPWEGGDTLPNGHVYLTKNATLTAGATFFQCTADNKKDIVVDLNGNTLTSDSCPYMQHMTLSIMDSKSGGVWECKGVASNGCVACVSTGAILNLYGGTLAETKDHVAYTGGVLHISGGTVNMYDGRILGGDDVGAVLVSPGTFNMTGGVIEGKNPNVHNITVQGDSNVTIGGNAVVNGGILVEDCNRFKLTGSPVINKGKDFGLKLPAGKKLTIENMTADAKIGITAPGAFATNADATVLESWKLNNFTADDLTKRIIVSGQDLTLETVTSITRCALGHTSHDGMTCPAEIVEWLPWTSTTSLPTSGNYFLTGNVTISPMTKVTGNVQIDLNGCDIISKFNDSVASNKRGMLLVSGNLGVTDLSGKTTLGAIRAELDAANIDDEDNYACYAGVVAYVTGKMTLYNGTLDGSACATNRTGGTTVAVESATYGTNGIFTMYGGTIQGVNGAKNTNGSTLCGWGKSIMNIHGGELIGRSGHKGANIYTTGELNITGGKFTGGVLRKNGTTNGLGQNIYFGGTGYDLTISGDAELNGGVYVSSCKSITLAGTPTIMNEDTYGLRLPAGVKADVNGLETDAQIGITLAADGAFATATDAAKLDALRHSFITDVATKEVVLVGNDLVQQDIPYVTKCLVGHETHDGANANCTAGEILNWLPWREKDELPTEAGNYYLLNDINLTTKTALVSGLNLDLNGYDITYTIPAGETTQAFSVAKNAVVNITDLSGSATPSSIVVDHADSNGEVDAGAVMYLRSGSVVSLYNITVDASDLSSTQKGSAAFAVEGGTLNVNNSKILGVNCKPNADGESVAHGSTIVAWGGNININGGELIGKGGGLSGNIYTTGNLTITGGKFVGGETYLENSASNIFVNGANSEVFISGDDINIDGGVYILKAKNIHVGGKAKIQAAMDSEALYDLRLGNGIAIQDAEKNTVATSVKGYYTVVYENGSVVKIAPVTEVVEAEQKLFVGYDREIITPDDPVPLAGYGNTSQRVSEHVLDDLFVTCIAMTDESGNTVLMMSQDTINSSVESTLRDDISSATGVPASNIIVAATHTHSAPNSSGTNISAWKTKYKAAAIKAAQDAIADKKEASMYVGAVATDGMNFTRHYVMEDGTVTGSNFGNWNQKIVGHQHENDPLLQVVKFDRDGEDDVYMMNFQAHPTMTGGYSNTDVSADFIGVVRDYVEQQLDGSNFAYFTGAAGNEVVDSRISSEKNNMTMDEYGTALGEYLVDLLPSLTKVKTTAFEVTSYTYTATIDHSMDDKVAQAEEVRNIWYNGAGKDAARAKAHEYGFSSEYHATAVIRKAGLGESDTITVSALSIGNWGMVVAPYEMFSVQGLYIKEESPFDMTFVVSCANGSKGYMAPADAYDYQSYESTTCNYTKGIAEDLADIYVKMLLVLKRTVN